MVVAAAQTGMEVTRARQATMPPVVGVVGVVGLLEVPASLAETVVQAATTIWALVAALEGPVRRTPGGPVAPVVVVVVQAAAAFRMV